MALIKARYDEVWKTIRKINTKKKPSILYIGCTDTPGAIPMLYFAPNNFDFSYKGVELKEGFDICKHHLKKKIQLYPSYGRS